MNMKRKPKSIAISASCLEGQLPADDVIATVYSTLLICQWGNIDFLNFYIDFIDGVIDYRKRVAAALAYRAVFR
jgi:hypothetical protein